MKERDYVCVREREVIERKSRRLREGQRESRRERLNEGEIDIKREREERGRVRE